MKTITIKASEVKVGDVIVHSRSNMDKVNAMALAKGDRISMTLTEKWPMIGRTAYWLPKADDQVKVYRQG